MTSDIDVTKYTIEASECEIKKIIPEVNLKLKFKVLFKEVIKF